MAGAQDRQGRQAWAVGAGEPASLNPEDAQHQIRAPGEPYVGMGDEGLVEGSPEAFTITQVDRCPAIRRTTELHVPCECGRPLVGIEIDLLEDTGGWSLHVHGICLSCGRQEAYYICPPGKETVANYTARVEMDVSRLTAQVLALRGVQQTAGAQ